MYKRHATRVASALEKSLGVSTETSVATKRGSFELFYGGDLVWSGLKKGPPRKDKFPEDDEIIKLIKEKMSA